MKLTIKINLDSAAMQASGAIAAMLRDMADRADSDTLVGLKFRDANGNYVASAEMRPGQYRLPQ